MKKLFPEIPCLHGERIVLKALTRKDAPALRELTESENVYRCLPTFLFEKRYKDINTVIDRLYTECLDDSLILGVFTDGGFCGLAELYGYRENIAKISIGYRLLEAYWGRGLASETVRVLTDHLYSNTNIGIITAGTMLENAASARVLIKNGFELVAHASPEDWGYPEPTPSDKWIKEI